MENGLILGWQVSAGLDPRYWLRPGAAAGHQPEEELVSVPAESIANHTAIIAQSGSGKSYFLGRLIEEMMLATKCRCLIFDPNADFRRIHQAETEELWSRPAYDLLHRLGKLPNEENGRDFKKRWSKVKKCILTRARSDAPIKPPYKALKVPLTSLSVEFIAGDVAPSFKTQIEHCHAFVEALGEIFAVLYQIGQSQGNLLEVAEGLVEANEDKFLREVERLCLFDLKEEGCRRGRFPFLVLPMSIEDKRKFANLICSHAIKTMESSRRYFTDEAVRFYFARVRQVEASQLLDTKITEGGYEEEQNWRLGVVDLPAFLEKPMRQLAVNALLKEEWHRAQSAWSIALAGDPKQDKRVPTIVVVDEAHNLMPALPISREEAIIREQFRTIVAEGRKYGIFLLLVTQRPDKVDPMILGECQNRALMRLSSGSVLRMAKSLLNLEDVPRQMLEKVLEFEAGRVLISGEWASRRPIIFYGCARRTVEGGRNLKSGFWAIP